MSTTRARQMDMTQGPIFSKIIIFILPIIATNLLQHFYNAADVMIVGMSPELDAVGAVSSAGSFLALITNIFIGFSTGAGVVVSRCFGAKDREGTSRAVHTSLLMSIIFGVIGSLLGIAITRPILAAIGFSGNLLELAVRYSYIYLACMPFQSLTNFLCAIMRAKGDSRTSLYVLSGTGVLNIGLNLFFVLVVGWSVEGVAVATAIANLVSAVILWLALTGENDPCRIELRRLRMSRSEFFEIAHLGFPAGIQNAMFSISNMIIQSSILEINNALAPAGAAYEPVVKGNAAGTSIEAFVFNALAATTVTASTFTGQNVGVHDYRRVRRVLLHTCIISSVIAVVMTVGIMVFCEPLAALYGVRNTEDTLGRIAYETYIIRMWWKWPPFILYAIMNAASGVLRGLGKSFSTAIIALVGTCLLRVVWIYTAFEAWPTLEVIYVSYPISWALSGAVFMVYAILDINKKIRLHGEEKAAEQ